MDHRAGMDSAYPMYPVPCSPALESMGECVKKIQKGCISGMAVRSTGIPELLRGRAFSLD